MSITTAQQTHISQLYVAFFNRAADGTGLGHWANDLATGRTIKDIAQDFYNSPEARDVYSGALSNRQFIEKFYTTVLGRNGDKEGLDYWTAELDTPGQNQGSVAVNIINALLADTSLNPVVVASQALFNAKVSVSTAYAIASGPVEGAQAVLAGVTDQASADAAIAAIGSGTIGLTFKLTEGVDNLHGTNGNDTFIANNTQTVKTLNTTDAINGGAGNNTLKVFLGEKDSGVALNGVSHIQNLYVHGGVPQKTLLDVSKLADLKNVELDSPVVNATSKNIGLNIGDGQAVKLSNIALKEFSASIDGNTATTANVTLNKVSGVAALQIDGTKMAELKLTAIGSDVIATLENAGAALDKLILSGDKAIILTPNAKTASSITLIDASGNTHGVGIDTSEGVKKANFKFIGSNSDDALYLAKGDLATLSGSLLDGGAGHNTLRVGETSFNGPEYVTLNATRNFDTLGFAADTVVIDASKVSTFKAFDVRGGSLTVNGVTDGFKVTVGDAQDALVLTKQADLINVTSTVSIGEAWSKGITIGKLDSDHVLSLVSKGDNTAVNTINTFNNYANVVVKVSGDNDLTFSLTNKGDVDASRFTGKLEVTSSGKSDLLRGGSGDDTFIIKAPSDATTTTVVSGGAGNDTFNVSAAIAGTGASADMYSKTSITDFSHGDTIMFGGAALFKSTALDAKENDTLASMLNKAMTDEGTANGLVSWFKFGNDTYLVNDLSDSTTMNANAIVVKLSGTHDFSQASLNSGALTLV